MEKPCQVQPLENLRSNYVCVFVYTVLCASSLENDMIIF